jgi:hypothetical protein
MTLSGRVARPFALLMIISAPWLNTTPISPLRVNILNLGCPVLDALQGRGLWFDGLRTNGNEQLSMKEGKSKNPTCHTA